MSELENKNLSKENETYMARRSRFTLEIVGAALFGALSIVLSALLVPIIPRIQGWGIAIIDPVSILWIICFLIFGARSGLLCCGIGTIGLMPFDPFAPIGPIMKFSATVPLIIIPVIFLKLYKSEMGIRVSRRIKVLKNYVLYGTLGTILRIGIMMIFNVLLFITLFSDSIAFVDLSFIGLSGISGWTAIIIGVIIINAETSLWDLLIPYSVVFGLKLDDMFEIW